MKAALFSLGTRGDIEPFLAVGEILRHKGWEVVCTFPEQFREEVEGLGYKFYGFDKAFLELLETQSGRNLMGGKGSWFHRALFVWKMAAKGMQIQHDIVTVQHELIVQEKPDRIIYHPKCPFGMIWGMANPGKSVMVSPIPCVSHRVKHLSVMGIRGSRDKGKFWNLLSFKIVDRIKSNMVIRFSKKYIHHYLKDIPTPSQIREMMQFKERTLYAISPTLFPRPEYWPEAAQVVGYYERNKSNQWEANRNLLHFIDRYEKIVFISFGSMVNNQPEKKTRAILQVLTQHQIPAIINTSWGGLLELDDQPEHIHFVSNIPYDWIFQRVYAVVHHGGSGTTHTTLKYGCANLIIPHIVDQFYWNNNISQLGAGPKGISIKHLNAKNFEPILLDLLQNSKYKQRAQEISQKIQLEFRPEEYYQSLTE